MHALIDTGCSVTLIDEKVIGGYEVLSSSLNLETMERRTLRTRGVVTLSSLRCDEVELGPVAAHVVSTLPQNVEMVIGLDIIARAGLSVRTGRFGVEVEFGRGRIASAGRAKRLQVDDVDFSAWFDGDRWTIKWVWKDNSEGEQKLSSYDGYVQDDYRDAFDCEIQQWITDGVLIRHDYERHGPVKRYLPMLAVRQMKSGVTKVRPVMDYRDLNQQIESHPGGATPACADRLREWRQLGAKCAVLDLKKAYLQVMVVQSLWTQQAIRWKGKVYLLTRLGFGLSCAPKILTAIVNKVLEQDQQVRAAVSGYIDDLFVDETRISSSLVKEHLSKWGLQAKEPEHLGVSNVRVLGMRVTKELQWCRDHDVPDVESNMMTRRQVHGVLGGWLGHFPVASWLRVACGYLQRCTAKEAIGWDDAVSPETLRKLKDVATRIREEGDPVWGAWPVDPYSPVTVWADASSVAIGVALEIGGEVIEDAAWLRSEADAAHINRAELDAVVKGVNMALRWGRRDIKIMTDSATVCGWLRSVIERTHNIRSRALGEVLIRRRLQTLQEVVCQEGLKLSVQYVRSAENRADPLTRVPKIWLREESVRSLPGLAAMNAQRISLDEVRAVHDRCHFGVDRTLELARESLGDSVSRRMVRKVVSRCQRCARIDPAQTFKWDHGTIGADRSWERLSADITHFRGRPYLTVIDVASRFTIWRPLRNESSTEVSVHLLSIFSEFGPPERLLTDNGCVFRSREVKELLKEWEVVSELSCAYRPQGNAIVERVHRTVKRSAARSRRGVEEAVFWLNNTRGNSHASPYELVFAARSRKPGVSEQRESIERPPLTRRTSSSDYRDVDRNPFSVGNRVYMRAPDGRCDSEWSGPHRITSILTSVSVEVNEDGVARHVSHLRAVPSDRCEEASLEGEGQEVSQGRGGGSWDSESEVTSGSVADVELEGEDSDTSGHHDDSLRRSSRSRSRPRWWDDYDVQIACCCGPTFPCRLSI